MRDLGINRIVEHIFRVYGLYATDRSTLERREEQYMNGSCDYAEWLGPNSLWRDAAIGVDTCPVDHHKND
jgi:hypothetical protein